MVYALSAQLLPWSLALPARPVCVYLVCMYAVRSTPTHHAVRRAPLPLHEPASTTRRASLSPDQQRTQTPSPLPRTHTHTPTHTHSLSLAQRRQLGQRSARSAGKRPLHSPIQTSERSMRRRQWQAPVCPNLIRQRSLVLGIPPQRAASRCLPEREQGCVCPAPCPPAIGCMPERPSACDGVPTPLSLVHGALVFFSFLLSSIASEPLRRAKTGGSICTSSVHTQYMYLGVSPHDVTNRWTAEGGQAGRPER